TPASSASATNGSAGGAPRPAALGLARAPAAGLRAGGPATAPTKGAGGDAGGGAAASAAGAGARGRGGWSAEGAGRAWAGGVGARLRDRGRRLDGWRLLRARRAPEERRDRSGDESGDGHEREPGALRACCGHPILLSAASAAEPAPASRPANATALPSFAP